MNDGGAGIQAGVMKLKLNGTITEILSGATVAALLESMAIEQARVAVEVNMEIIRKKDYGGHVLRDGDTIEIVNFVGGG